METFEVLQEVGFRFNARFGQLIGRNLISNPIVAVSELVKNAYDADAGNISIIFENLKSGTSSLKIVDDGDGMSLSDLTNKWMMVGTDNKLRETYTTKGRRKLGEKGIGRFSVERLAKRLTIKTSQKGNAHALMIFINWDEYENTSLEFSDIKHKIIKISSQSDSCGTELLLEDLRDSWDETMLFNVRKELNLIRPININKVSHKKYEFKGTDVKIKLISYDYKTKTGTINSTFMEYAQAHLYGEIDSSGSGIVRVMIKSNISMSKEVINETYLFSPEDIDSSCGPVTYEAFVFLKDQRLYKSLDIDRTIFKDLLESYSGIKIYRDGFRILPFGDADNDWLELNAKRTSSPEHRIATTNTIGIVYITRDENPGLQDVLSRENMYDTHEFNSLKQFVNIAFEKYTNLQLSARKKAQKKQLDEGKAVLNNAEKSVKTFFNQVNTLQQKLTQTKEEKNSQQQAEKIVSIGNELSTLMNTAETSLNTVKYAYTYYRKQENFKSREMQIYRNIATLGISAAMFGHEALHQTTDAKVISGQIVDDFEFITEDLIKLKALVEELQKDILLIDEKADFFRNYLRREKQDRARYVNLYKALKTIAKQHEKAFRAINALIRIKEKVDINLLNTWGYEGDFDTIFTNLITNAYKALKKGKEDKYLIFELNNIDGNIEIIAFNNGQSIEEQIRPKIFEPLFSTYSDGTGLGLTIIQDTIIGYKGTIHLCPEYPETKFKLVIPQKNEPKEYE
ncbi:MAG: hypothetical protein CVV02_01500 [Firmicutes bacterium HGW-Firmicutes-7]|nr:MAG: hypothetical protein CVV02_01500 [Firmicutes bacterium HGW-Firmicutes-7]